MFNDFQKKAIINQLHKNGHEIVDMKLYTPLEADFTCFYTKFKYNEGVAYTKSLIWHIDGTPFVTVEKSITKFLELIDNIDVSLNHKLDYKFFENQIIMHLHVINDFNIVIQKSIYKYLNQIIPSYKSNSSFFSDLDNINPKEHYSFKE